MLTYSYTTQSGKRGFPNGKLNDLLLLVRQFIEQAARQKASKNYSGKNMCIYK